MGMPDTQREHSSYDLAMFVVNNAPRVLAYPALHNDGNLRALTLVASHSSAKKHMEEVAAHRLPRPIRGTLRNHATRKLAKDIRCRLHAVQLPLSQLTRGDVHLW